jgi:tight adherence protein C
MTALLLLVALPSIAVSAFLVAEAVSGPAREREAALRRVARYGRSGVGARGGSDLLLRVAAALARVAVRVDPRTDAGAVAAELRAAGLSRRISVQTFLAARVGATAFGAAVGLLLALPHESVRGVVVAAALAGVGYVAPALVVRSAVRRRRQEIGPALPDALDLLCVCVQAGLGIDASIQKLVEHSHGPLADEFELMLAEMRIGESRHDALRKLAERADVPELSAVVRAILHADQQGTPLSRVLAVQATEVRTKRQLAAENDANKTPVKMLFPTMMFIFPALFVVVLGPALLTIAHSL